MTRRLHLPSGIRNGLDFLVDADWSPRQALAIFALLSDWRARIWRHYGVELQQLLREQRSPADDADIDGAF
jgi:hypothetical protein